MTHSAPLVVGRFDAPEICEARAGQLLPLTKCRNLGFRDLWSSDRLEVLGALRQPGDEGLARGLAQLRRREEDPRQDWVFRPRRARRARRAVAPGRPALYRLGVTMAGRSGFMLLHRGLDAFVARVALIELADRAIDLQYYIFHADTTGAILVDRLIAAAERGVRVRALLDDWGTLDKSDFAVACLATHPQVEIRLFNPYCNRSPVRRVGELLTSFSRVNRRMHNKQLIADGRAVVLGGRNIGDEYFDLGELRFQDIDVLGIGPVAEQSSASFEAYWNSEFAVPISQLGKFEVSAAGFAAQRRELGERIEGGRDSAYARALAESDFATALRTRSLELHWAQGEVLADPPDKVKKPAGASETGYLGEQLGPYARAARSELLVASAYFVPGERGVKLLSDKRREGVKVSILTNSLAATDVWLVHSAYRRYRRALLEQGVSLYELMPGSQTAAGARANLGSSRASLHAKTFVFDREAVFIGSVNVDSRSLVQNTEVGVMVRSPELAGEVAALFEVWIGAELAYAVSLAGSRLRWAGRYDGRATEVTREPGAGLWRRLGAAAFSVLPIESQI